jgi:hypothetical protein
VDADTLEWNCHVDDLVTSHHERRPLSEISISGHPHSRPTDREVHDVVAQQYLLDHEPGARRQQHSGPAIRQARVVYRNKPARRKFTQANLDITFARPNWTQTAFLAALKPNPEPTLIWLVRRVEGLTCLER